MSSHPLTEYREKKGWSQAELGELLGVSRQMIGFIESGDRRIKDEHVLDWEQKTGIPRFKLRPDLYPPSEYGVRRRLAA